MSALLIGNVFMGSKSLKVVKVLKNYLEFAN